MTRSRFDHAEVCGLRSRVVQNEKGRSPTLPCPLRELHILTGFWMYHKRNVKG